MLAIRPSAGGQGWLDPTLALGLASLLVSVGVAGRQLAAGSPSAGTIAWNLALPLLTCAFAVVVVRRTDGRLLHPSAIALGLTWLAAVALMVRGRQLGVPVTWNLVWNVFLAWVPYVWATLLLTAPRTHARGLTWLLTGLWLVFFPNALYVVTDAIWLPQQARGGMPVAYDIAVYVTAAASGIALGFLSLRRVHEVVDRLHGARAGWAFAGLSMLLAGGGIALGRVLHRNSWDVVLRPSALMRDVASGLSSPTTVAAVVLGSAVALGAYVAWRRAFPGRARCAGGA